MARQRRDLLRAFLQGFTGAGLFRKLDYPGAPTEFVDSRPVEQIMASGEFDATCRRYGFGREKDEEESGAHEAAAAH